MNYSPIRILLVEDNPADVEIVRKMVHLQTNQQYQLTQVDTLKEGLARLRDNNFDVVLLDLHLPDSEGLETVEQVQQAAPEVAIIVATGTDDEQLGATAVKKGAQDYLVKDRMDSALVIRSILYAIERKNYQLQILKARDELEHKVRRRTSELRQTIRSLEREARERAIAETALTESKELFDAFMEHLPGCAFIKDRNGKFLYLNDYALEHLNLDSERCREVTEYDVLPSDLAEQAKKDDEHIYLTGQTVERISKFSINGKPVTNLIYKFPIYRENRPSLIGAVAIDISERVQAEQALIQSEHQYRELVENANSIILKHDIKGRVTFFNEFAQNFFGYSEDEILGKDLVGTIVPRNNQQGRDMSRMIEDISHHPESYTSYENENICRDGTRVWVSWTNKPIFDKSGQMTGILSVGNDITERRNLEKQLLRISEEEQQRMGQALHDGLGQQLTGLSFNVKVLEKRLAKENRPEAEEIRRISENINDAISKSRNMARMLSPVDFKAGGLPLALNELAANTEELFGIRCICHCSDDFQRLDNETANHLYRIAQEAVTNAIRHGKAKNITIRLSLAGKRALLGVMNDGKPFPARNDSEQPQGLGLQIMHYRTKMISGNLNIRSTAKGRTIIACTFPSSKLVNRKLPDGQKGKASKV